MAYANGPSVTASSAWEAWRSSRRVGLIWKNLGLQGEFHKIRMAAKKLGPWKGIKVHVFEESVYQLLGE